ncbi:MAG: M23 family metallopeptidase [Syntrophobacterales bacterium]|nr:MAG: M23 family metallopeptidase [Syntrophobacterales bacterium]
MRKKISFLVLSNSGSPAKQFCASRSTLRWAAVLAAAFIVVTGFVGYDYVQLKRASLHLQQREAELTGMLAGQRDEVDLQRKQIGDFAGEINSLKEKLLALNQFEKKIRVMADFEKRPDAGNLFGVGGSVPKAMDPKAAFSEQRNGLIREMRSQVGQLNLATVNQDNGFASLVTHLEKQQRLLASTPTIRPIDPDSECWVSSKFDWRTSPFTNQREFHKGFDVAVREGTPIYVTAAGVVTFAGNNGLLGKTVVVDHGHGITTTYGHCSRILKLKGEKVNRWETIALVGNTGNSTGPHVHYEVAIYGVQVNPEKYFLN